MFKLLLNYIYIFYFVIKFTKCDLINENLNNKQPLINVEKIPGIKADDQNMIYYKYNSLMDQNIPLPNDKDKAKKRRKEKKDKRSKKLSKKEKRNEGVSFIEKFPQFEEVESQKLLLLNPSPKCRIPQRTVFFQYPSFMESNINENVSEVEITNKEYFVGAIQQFKSDVTSRFTHNSIKRVFSINGLIRLFDMDDVNLCWRGIRKDSVIPYNIHKYQKFNHMLMFHEITRKHLLYKNYNIFRKAFPNEYNFMPETYTHSSIDEFREKFKNYKVSKDNLWLIKPRNSSLGKGIRFLKDVDEVRNHDIVTRYIADPLLIDGKKFDLRFHVLVTGHDPLKIYIHTNGWAKLSSEKYDLDLNNLDNIYKHVTNLSLNMRNKKSGMKPKDIVLSFEYVKNYLKEHYKMDFPAFEKKVRDVVIKSIISMNYLEIRKEKEYKLKSNNIFDLYGVDIMVDSHFNPWLLEININPYLGEEDINMERKKLLSETLVDTLNVVGMVPYSHVNGKAYEGDYEIKNPVEEAIEQTICEFTRPMGGFERIFPLKNNIDKYKKYFEVISANNQALWDEIQRNE